MAQGQKGSGSERIMGDWSMNRRMRGWWLAFLAVLAAGTTVAATYFHFGRSAPSEQLSAPPSIQPSLVSPLQIAEYCGKCHAYPPADSFPRSAWKEEVEKAYTLIAQSQLYGKRPHVPPPPPMEQVLQYYEEQAPLTLPRAIIEKASGPLPLRLVQTDYPPPADAAEPAIANVNLVHLFDERRLDVLACDMRAGRVMALRPYAPRQPGRFWVP